MFSPQLADYDDDGLTDLISGSTCCQHPNCFYVFRRLPDGRFAARRAVNLSLPSDLMKGELPVNGLKSKVAIADWNGDGVPDALVGGNMRVLGVAYGPLGGKEEVTVQRLWPKGQEPLTWVSTNPCVADWDGDGLPDLIVGGCRGGPDEPFKAPGVYWLRNTGTKREAKLAAPELLVIGDDMQPLTGISIADWNGDGRLDLIAARLDYEMTGSGQKQERILRHHKVWVYLRRSP
jgi:hypothetical protein